MLETVTTAVTEKAEDKGLWRGIEIPVLGVSGEYTSGKSLFLMTICPEETAYVDFELSTSSYSIPVKKKWEFYTEMQAKYDRMPTPEEAFLWFRDLVDNIEPGEYRVFVADPINDIEAGMVDWVRKNPQAFGRTANQYEKAGGLLWGDVKSYWKMILGILSSKVETFAFATHMGSVWKKGEPTGRRKPKGKETLYELASLYVLLDRNPDAKGKISKLPHGTISPPHGKSRLAITTVQNGTVDVTPILPPRMEVCTPDSIRNYIQTPPDYDKLKKTELVPPEVMSADDRLLLQREIASDNRDAAEFQAGRMDRLKESAEQQAKLRSKEKTTETKAATMEPTETDVPSGDTNSKPTLAELHKIIGDQFRDLQIDQHNISAVLKKRGATTITELDMEQAKDLKGKLWSKLTQRDMEKKG